MTAAIRGQAASLQHSVANEVLFQSTDVELALNQQVAHATKVTAALEKRLFALQAELQQARDSARGAATVLQDVRQSRETVITPRASASSTPRRRGFNSTETAPWATTEALDGAIDAVSGSISLLTALIAEMHTLEGRLSVQIRWLRDLIARDSDCLTSVSCRPQRAREYRHHGGVQLSGSMSLSEWPSQANATFLEAAEAMRRSTEARKSTYEVCRQAQLVAARTKKAALDQLAGSVTARLEQRHALECELENVSKRAHDTSKSLDSARQQLQTMKAPLKVALARQVARQETDDAVGHALKSEKAVVVRGYRQLRNLTKQLQDDLDDMNVHRSDLRHDISTLETTLSADKQAMMSENALRVTLAPQPPQRSSVRTYHTGNHVGTNGMGPNPISWDPNATAARELPFSLWNNLCARQYPGQRRDGTHSSSSPRDKSKSGARVPKPPPKSGRR
jgi:hypothetical protein